jgi:dynein regulatory complex protein 1
MENSATLSQQKRKLTRLKDALSTLISKYNQTDARDRNQNQELTEEYRRLTKQYKDLQKKYAHFETSDRNKYDEVWMMHEKEAVEKIEKLLNADKIIHEQQLGLVWKRPAQSIRDWSQIGAMKKKKQEQLSAGARTSDERGDGDMDNHHDGRNGDAFGEIDLPVARKISSSKLKYMLKLLAIEAGFLVNGNFQLALENLPDDEAELVKVDMIMRALGVDNEDDMERLMGFFFQDPRAEVPMEYGSSSGSSSNLNGMPQQVPTPKWGLMIGPEDVIRVIKQFVEVRSAKQLVYCAHAIAWLCLMPLLLPCSPIGNE